MKVTCTNCKVNNQLSIFELDQINFCEQCGQVVEPTATEVLIDMFFELAIILAVAIGLALVFGYLIPHIGFQMWRS